MDINYFVKYSLAGKKKEISFTNNYSDSVLKFSSEASEAHFSLQLQTHTSVVLIAVKAEIQHVFHKADHFFVNGFQSWTDSREYSQTDRMKQLPAFGKLLDPKYKFSQYGDYRFYQHKSAKGEFYGYAFAYIRNEKGYDAFYSNNENKAHTAIAFSVKQNKIMFTPDCEGLQINGKTRLLSIHRRRGKESDIHSFLADFSKPIAAQPIVGWTSWYNYYQNINESIIKHNLNAFEKHFPKGSIFQIDDGFQKYVGDWLDLNTHKFPNGLSPLVKNIHDKGFQAGLWLAPFAAEKKSQLIQKHPEWILKDNLGQKVEAGHNWGGFYALDLYNPDFRIYLREVFYTVLKSWKFDMLKLDFLYAAAIIPRKGKTRAMIMCDAMDFIRELMGDKKLLACGVPLGQAFNKAEYCRVGCDVGLDWNGKFYEKWIFRERVSTLNSLKNTIARRFFDKNLFLNDPDVFLLRNENIQLSKNQKITLFLVNCIFGSLVFTSDDLEKYGEWQKELLSQLHFFHKAQVLEVNEHQELFEFDFVIDGNTYRGFSNLSSKTRYIEPGSNSELDIYKAKPLDKNTHYTLEPFQTKIYAR